MDRIELLQNLYQYAIDELTYEEYHGLGKPEDFHKWVEDHYRVIPKKELVAGREYNGVCRNATKAIWDGKKFAYRRRKFGSTYTERIKHYEDDDEQGYDVFVPIEEL